MTKAQTTSGLKVAQIISSTDICLELFLLL